MYCMTVGELQLFSALVSLVEIQVLELDWNIGCGITESCWGLISALLSGLLTSL